MNATPDMFRNVCGVIEARYPARPGCRPTAPETSEAAATSIRTSADTLRAACLRERSYTADEVAKKLGESVLSIRPRFSELKALARIVDSGIRRINSSGKSAVVWRLA